MNRVLPFVLVSVLALHAVADPALEKPVTKLVKAVQVEEDELAIKVLDGETEGALLLGEAWTKATDAQRKEFVSLFHQLFAAVAFPKLRENFKYLSTTTFEPSKADGDKAELKGTLVIDHPVKKQELKLKFDLKKGAKGWNVVDVTVLGTGSPSMLSGIREDQVEPLLEKGGLDKLLETMRDRLAKLKSKK